MAVTVTRPARTAVAMPVALTARTLVSVLAHVTPVTGAPALLETVNGCASPLRSTERVAVTCKVPPDGDVGVVELLSQPARRKASPAIAVATRRDVTRRL